MMADSVAVATSNMLESAKKNASMDDTENRDRLVAATDNLRNISGEVVNIMNRRKLFNKLAQLTKNLSDKGKVYVEACNAGKQFNKNNQSKTGLAKLCGHFKEHTASVDETVKITQENPASARYQMELVETVKNLIPMAVSLMKAGREGAAFVDNENAKKRMEATHADFKTALKAIVDQYKLAGSLTSQLAFAAAQENLESSRDEFQNMDGLLDNPDPSLKAPEISEVMMKSSAVLSVMQKMTRALDAENVGEVRNLSIELGNSINQLVASMKDVARTREEKEQAMLLIEAARNLIQSSSNYLEQLNKYSTYGAMNDDLRKSLRDGDKDLSNNVNNASETCKAVMSSAKGAEMEGDLMDIKMNINKILNDINSANNPNELGKGLNNLVSEGQKVFGEYEKASSYASNDGAKKAMAMGCNELNKQLDKFKEDTSKETNPEILKTMANEFGGDIKRSIDGMSKLILYKELAKEAQKSSAAAVEMISSLENNGHVGDDNVDNIEGMKEIIEQVTQSLGSFEENNCSALSQYNLLNDVHEFLWQGNNLTENEKLDLDEDMEESLMKFEEALADLQKAKQKLADLSNLEIEAAGELLTVLDQEFEEFKANPKAAQPLIPEQKKWMEESFIINSNGLSTLINLLTASVLKNDINSVRSNAIKLAQTFEAFQSDLKGMLGMKRPEKRDQIIAQNKQLMDEGIKLFHLLKVLHLYKTFELRAMTMHYNFRILKIPEGEGKQLRKLWIIQDNF